MSATAAWGAGMTYVAADPTAPAFEAEFSSLWQRAYRVSYRLVGSSALAEEIAQEALARACADWARVGGHAEAWVSRVAYNLAIDEIRRHKRAERWSFLGAASSIEAAGLDDRMDLADALRRLPKRQREVVVLRYLADQSQAATATALGITQSTVARHAAAGLSALQEHMKRPSAVPEVRHV